MPEAPSFQPDINPINYQQVTAGTVAVAVDLPPHESVKDAIDKGHLPHSAQLSQKKQEGHQPASPTVTDYARAFQTGAASSRA